MDISNLSLNELRQLKKKIESAIKNFEDRKLETARAELEAKAKELGVSLQEIVKAPMKRRRASPKPKYANPKDPNETWSGRGRTPLWLSELLENGRNKEEFEIS